MCVGSDHDISVSRERHVSISPRDMRCYIYLSFQLYTIISSNYDSLSIYPSIYLSIYLSISLRIYQSIYAKTRHEKNMWRLKACRMGKPSVPQYATAVICAPFGGGPFADRFVGRYMFVYVDVYRGSICVGGRRTRDWRICVWFAAARL